MKTDLAMLISNIPALNLKNNSIIYENIFVMCSHINIDIIRYIVYILKFLYKPKFFDVFSEKNNE